MPVVIGETRRQVVDRLLSEGSYDWARGDSTTWTPDAEESARNERRMEERYRAWAAANMVTYTPSKFESAFRTYKDMPFETINPVNDRIQLPGPHYDQKLKKWVVPKNVFDKNVLSRKRFLFEIDGMTLDAQEAMLQPLLERRVIQRVVYSGNKSLHCVIEEEDEPDVSENDQMYKWLWRFMAWNYFKDGRFRDVSLTMKIDNTFIEVVDNRCGHPSRTTRSPFAIRKDESTGFRSVEQKLLYFKNVRVDSGWRRVYRQMKVREEAERARMQRQAQRNAWRNRDQGKKIPNAVAQRFMGRDMSDGWKHANMGSAVASLKACGYSRDEVDAIFLPYSKELRTFAMRCYDHFERRDRR